MPIVDKLIKDFYGKIVNFVDLTQFTFGKELQLHILEIKANSPFRSPEVFEETLHGAVTTLSSFLKKKYNANLLGTGMHPTMSLGQTGVWPHRHRKLYQEYSRIFNLKQHGWLNIQSFHLNLPYAKDTAVKMHNLLSNLCPYLPAISASSPIYEGKLGSKVDNRLAFYKSNQKEVPSISGDIVPEYVNSIADYKKYIIGRYSDDLRKAGAADFLLDKEWVNSRGVIFRFDRSALEIRVMDEQECIKSDVALSCFVRSALRGLISSETELLSHSLLVNDFESVLASGFEARVQNPFGPTARQVCKHFYNLAWLHAEKEEKKYLPLIQKRIEEGNLSEIIRKNVMKRVQKTDFNNAVVDVYSKLIKCLVSNQPYS